jgi:hypothetical protein
MRTLLLLPAFSLLIPPSLSAPSTAAPAQTQAQPQAQADFHPATCEGSYPRHLQGVCTNDRDAIYWCWTDCLVKTDRDGRLLKRIEVQSHHGDLCHHQGRIHVATNLGKFNRPAGEADNWVYVYAADDLRELARHPLPEVLHGAGGITSRAGHFFVVGGLPPGAKDNLVYEYDADFHFLKAHQLGSGYSLMGIQTAAHHQGQFWFGCYGKPAVLLRADAQLRCTGRWDFNASVGIVPISGGRFLIAENKATQGPDGKTKSNRARLRLAQPDPNQGLILTGP